MIDCLILIIWAYILPVNIIRLVGHAFIKFFRRLGIASFFLYIILWISWAILVFMNRSLFLKGEIFSPNIAVVIVGVGIFAAGLLLQILGFKALGVRTVFGIPELMAKKQKSTLFVKGPFLLVRHPLYLGQLLLIVGALLVTFEYSLCILLIAVTALLWPITALEEKELMDRFGDEYRRYQKQVPRILPRI